LSLAAQTIVVKDDVTLQPIEGVYLYSADTKINAYTDASGRASLKEVSAATKVIVSAVGYESRQLTLSEIAAGNYTILLTEARINLNEVVVSANRWEQNSREVPVRITAISAKEIALQNPQTAADLIGLSGEASIQKSQYGGGSPIIRGFAANRVVLVVDGVRMNNAIYRSGNLQNIISLDPQAVENAEIVFGPGSVVYGSDAIGGVMDFHTLRAKFTTAESPALFKGSTSVRYGTASKEKTAHVDFNIGLRKWAFVTSASFSDFGDLRMGSDGPEEFLRPEYAVRLNGKDTIVRNEDPLVQVPSGYQQINLMQKVRWKPSDHWELNYSLHYSATTDVPRYDRLIEYAGTDLRASEWYYGPQVWLMNNLRIQHQAASGLYDNARLILAHQRYEESRHDRRFGRDQLRHRYEEVNVISANLDLEKAIGDKHTLYYGTELLLNKVGSTAEEENIASGNIRPLSTRYPDGSTWNAAAAYLSWKSKLSDKLYLLAGVRYNYVTLESQFDTAFFPFPIIETKRSMGALNGSLGFTYLPDANWQFSLNGSTGFRAPNIDDVGKVFDSAPGTVIIANPDINPEYAYSGEIGITRRFGQSVSLEVTGYYTLLDDALVRRTYQLNGQDSIVYDGELSQVFAIQNSAQAWVWGIQAGLDVQLGGGLSLSSRFSYQQGKEQDDDNTAYVPLRHAAPWFGVTRLRYQRTRFQAEIYAEYSGALSFEELAPSEQIKPYLYAKDDQGRPYSPAWYTLNLKLNYQLLDWLQLNGGLENISDQRYRTYASGITAPGRNAVVAVRVRW
ncbi:MAG: TonB-dependent receptor, partial [Saprospiraceae bacterium]|nr:TonB-dependent receptor [Saprospiraceae bacterium]